MRRVFKNCLVASYCIGFLPHACSFLRSTSFVHRRQPHLSVSSSSTDANTILTLDQVALPNGTSMQVLSGAQKRNQKQQKNKVLLFLHGSFHGSWCWQEHFLPYFVQAGYTVVAPDWRGTGGTPAEPGVRKVTIAQHVQDLEGLLQILPGLLQERQQATKSLTDVRPIVIAHSFGGIALMKYLEVHSQSQPFRGIVTFCSVPPSGNGKLTLRYLRRSLRDSWTITAGFAMKRCLTNEDMCRQLFFGGEKIVGENGHVEDFGVSDEDIRRFQSYFERDSAATIDLMDLSKQLPSKLTDSVGKASFLDDSFPPSLVVGASNDYIVDSEAVQETANYFGLSVPVIVDSPHDVMLGRNWMNAAKTLELWLEENC